MSALSKRWVRLGLVCLVCLLLPFTAFAAAKYVKKGPSGSSTGTALFMLLDDAPAPNACIAVNTSTTATACGTHYVTNIPVYEPTKTSVSIQSLSCIWDDGNVAIGGGAAAADELNLCVAYQLEDDSVTDTAACITWDDGGTATTIIETSTTVPVVIPENEFGLLLRVISITDVNSTWRGSCTVRWTTAN